jgi:hypothetical protein
VWSNHTQFCLLSDTAGYRRGRIVVLQPFIRHRHGKIHSPGAATSSEPEWRFPLACAPKFRMELGCTIGRLQRWPGAGWRGRRPVGQGAYPSECAQTGSDPSQDSPLASGDLSRLLAVTRSKMPSFGIFPKFRAQAAGRGAASAVWAPPTRAFVSRGNAKILYPILVALALFP